MAIVVGLKGRAETIVTDSNTASAVGSGLVPVFATPYMIAIMENAAVNALLSCLSDTEGSVGTHLDVSHDAATPIGMKVWAEAEVTAVEGKKITFSVIAFDEAGPIGNAVHKRALVNAQRFLDKTYAKL